MRAVPLFLGVFMGALDMGIIAPGLGILSSGLHTSVALAVWIVTIYSLAYATAMPVIGKLSDRMGRKPVFIAGVAIFGLGSLLAGLSTSLPAILAARALQAVGGGGVLPVATAEIGSVVRPEKRGMALGMIGATYGLATIIAPNVGGFLLSHFSWHWLFFVNVPVAVLIVLLAAASPATRVERHPSPIDTAGALLLGGGVLSLMGGLASMDKSAGGGFSLAGLGLVTLGILLVAGFLKAEGKAKDPIVHPELWSRPGVAATLLLGVMTGASMATMLFMPLFGQRVLGLAVGPSGYALTPMALSAFVIAGMGGMLVDKRGPKTVLAIGFGAYLLGMLTLAVTHGLALFIVAMILFGLGTGLTMGAPLNYLILGLLPQHTHGTGTAVMGVSRSIGVAMGSVLFAFFLPNYPLLFAVAALLGLFSLGLCFSLPSISAEGAGRPMRRPAQG